MSEALSRASSLLDRLRALDASVGMSAQVEEQLALVVALLTQAEQAMAEAVAASHVPVTMDAPPAVHVDAHGRDDSATTGTPQGSRAEPSETPRERRLEELPVKGATQEQVQGDRASPGGTWTPERLRGDEAAEAAPSEAPEATKVVNAAADAGADAHGGLVAAERVEEHDADAAVVPTAAVPPEPAALRDDRAGDMEVDAAATSAGEASAPVGSAADAAALDSHEELVDDAPAGAPILHTAPVPAEEPSMPLIPRPIPPAPADLRDYATSAAVIHPGGRGAEFTPIAASQPPGARDVAEAVRARQAMTSVLDGVGVDRGGGPGEMMSSTASLTNKAHNSPPLQQTQAMHPPARTPALSTGGGSSASSASPPSRVPAQKPVALPPTNSHVAAPQRHAVEARLPNANAGRLYDTDITAVLPAGTHVRFVGALPEGLRIDVDKGRLIGTPTVAGEYRIGWQRTDGHAIGALLLTVNADPRALWQDKASDRTDRYWKPDADSASGESPVARAVVASVRGRSHAHVGSFRDDDFALHMPSADEGPHGWHVLVVADGAGSAKYSREGSRIACEVVAKHLVETLRSPEARDVAELVERSLHATEQDKSDSTFWSPRIYNTLVPAVNKAQSAVRAQADALGVAKKDFHTTLLVAIVRRTTAGAWFVGTYWIGDGAIGMWDDAWAAPKIFGEADSGEFAGETTFLTHEDFNKTEVVNRRLRYSIVPSFSYLALMTDGISDPKFDAETKLKSPDVWRVFTADLCTATEGAPLADMSEAQLLDWMQFWSQGNHDDRTLLLFHPRESAGGTA